MSHKLGITIAVLIVAGMSALWLSFMQVKALADYQASCELMSNTAQTNYWYECPAPQEAR